MTKLIKFCRIYIYIYIIMQQLLEEQKVMKKTTNKSNEL
jgi:hypothetical protein